MGYQSMRYLYLISNRVIELSQTKFAILRTLINIKFTFKQLITKYEQDIVPQQQAAL